MQVGAARAVWLRSGSTFRSATAGLVSGSALRYGPYSAVPGALDDPGRAEVLASFVRAARRAAELGVDVLELDLAHGYLLGSFLSPLSNPTATGRFPSRSWTPFARSGRAALAVRISVTDWHPKGNSVEDGIAVARDLREAGVDLIHVEAGQTVHDDRPEYRRGFLTALSDRVRNEARIATLVRGHPDDGRRSEHDRGRRPRRPVPPRPPSRPWTLGRRAK